MKKQFKGFVIGVLVTLILTSTIAFAGGVKQKIDVVLNSINLTVNGKAVKTDNILYKGTTYVPIRAVGEMLGKDVTWDNKTNTAGINDKGFKEPVQPTKPKDTSKSNDFRNIKWGMTLEDVKKNEKAEFFGSMDNILMYKTKVMNMDATLVYEFNEKNQLYSAMYMLDETYTNLNSYIDDYFILKEDLTSKYGKPTDDEVIWLNDLFKDNYQDWGLAISIGHLKYTSKWNTDNTEIQMLLTGNNYNVDIGISYKSRSIEKPKTNSSL